MNVAERVRQAAMAERLVVRCLGTFRVETPAGDQLKIRTRKARALLAVLALTGRPMSRERLADLLWSDRGSTQAKSSLRQAIFELQHFECGGVAVLAARGNDLAVHRKHLVTDIEIAKTAAADWDWGRLITLLQGAGSGLLTDLDGLDAEFDDWLRQHRAQEPARTLAAITEAAEQCRAAAGSRAALDLVSEILRIDPVNEEATRLALQIDHDLGDRRALHNHYQSLTRQLRDAYDVDPSPETAELFRRLANGSGTVLPGAQPRAHEPRAEPGGRSQWPLTLTPLVILAVAISLLFVLVKRSIAEPAPSNPVVAVLPFERQPQDRSFLAEGLWEQTRGVLTQNPAIHVLGRTTTAAMVGQKFGPEEFRNRLGVTHLLEGSVRRNGTHFQVSVSLTRTSDGVEIWHDLYRGRMREPFALQDAIANGIEGKLRARLSPEGGRRADQIPTTPEVYALYSEARQLISSRERANFRRAEALLRQAVKTDPNYAPAWSLLGGAIHFSGRLAIVDAKARAEGMAAVRRALSMAPNFAPAHATLALIQGDSSPEAEPQLRQAVALDPNYSEAWNWLGNSLSSQGRHREAVVAYQRALEIDPLLQPAVLNLASIAAELGDTAALDRLESVALKAGATPELLISLKVQRATQERDYSKALKLLTERGIDSNGRPKRLLWENWFEALAGIGHYDVLHQVTGCPDWYPALARGEILPPTAFDGRPVTPEEFWTSFFFSAPASRVMINRGRSGELIDLYRAQFRNADAFITQTERQDMLPELAANVAVALRATGQSADADYILSNASARIEQSLRSTPLASGYGRLALVRSAQGDRAQAIALIERAVAKRWLPDGRAVALDLAQEPAFRPLRGDTRFEAARKRILNHIAKERAELGPLQV
jgi:DNA-binding SARP family transcriptional activator/TolB-like protein/Flp pilus assembly protein TadD